jgi:hypothetical protein
LIVNVNLKRTRERCRAWRAADGRALRQRRLVYADCAAFRRHGEIFSKRFSKSFSKRFGGSFATALSRSRNSDCGGIGGKQLCQKFAIEGQEA